MNPINAQFMRDHFTLIHVNDKPDGVHVSIDDMRLILEALTHGAGRLKGTRDPLADRIAAADLGCTAAMVRELLGDK